MKKDSLGARVVESRHTGRWRFACSEMHNYFKTVASPGKLSEAYKTGMETQHSTHSGNWDRNPLVAAMLEIKLSMTGHPLDKSTFDTLTLWDRVCGGATNIAITPLDHTGAGPAGYRVPTSKEWDPDFATYGNGDVPITDFAPVVAYGSLEMLRSMRMTNMMACPDKLDDADALMHQYCQEGQEYLANEMLTRQQYAPFSLQRDVWCNPHAELTIEQTAGNPEYFDEVRVVHFEHVDVPIRNSDAFNTQLTTDSKCVFRFLNVCVFAATLRYWSQGSVQDKQLGGQGSRAWRGEH